MKVRLTPDAEAALVNIAEYIARDSPIRALSFVRHLRVKAREIGSNPLLYPVQPRWSEHNIRQRVVGDDIINYVILPDRVSILDIRHGARDVAQDP